QSGSLLPSQQQSSKSAIDTLAADDSRIQSIFAYGSWIWKPHFRYKELAIGIALGFSRQLFQGSFQDYGRPSWPGRIATIVPNPDSGVLGCLYQLSRRHAIEDIARADAHQATRGFHRSQLVVENCTTGKTETCWVYIARKEEDNPYWLGRAEPSEIAFQVSQASGSRGPNLDYVRRLVDFVRLQTRGVIDRDLDTKRVLRLATSENSNDQRLQSPPPSQQQQHLEYKREREDDRD
uniref:glutathione-specific gamma-glutamylcyclotransferase n=1 Tax=Macrostomum lignano TaxID=282301 RepID=A0A1I8J4P5_9PLAT